MIFLYFMKVDDVHFGTKMIIIVQFYFVCILYG
jgi:hypothetical protein